MGFDLRRVQSEISLNRISPERLPSVAQDALEAGFDGPAIVRMAILERPSGWETDRLLPAFLKELGVTVLSKSEASVQFAYCMAREILETSADPLVWSDRFQRLWIDADYSKEITVLGTLSDDIYLGLECFGKSENQVRDEVNRTLFNFVHKVDDATRSSLSKCEIWRKMDKTLRKFASKEEMRAETYRYWRSRSDGEVFDAIAEMSEQAWNAWCRSKGITPKLKDRRDLLLALTTVRARQHSHTSTPCEFFEQ